MADTDIRPIVKKCVKRLFAAGRFNFARHLDPDDLEAEALEAVATALPSFNPKKASLSTFVYVVAWRRLVTLGRYWHNRHIAEVGAAESHDHRREVRYDPERTETFLAEEIADPDQTLPEWLASCYAAARLRYPPSGAHWSRFTRAHGLAITMLAWKLRISAGETWRKLRNDQDLCTALDLPRVPSAPWVKRAIADHAPFVTKLVEKPFKRHNNQSRKTSVNNCG